MSLGSPPAPQPGAPGGGVPWAALAAEAVGELYAAFGGDGPVAQAVAPGRCTLVGDHVDYADGWVVATAIDSGVAVAVRRSPAGTWRLASAGRRVERAAPHPAGDLGDRPFAVALVLERRGLGIPPVDLGVAASLPEASGLASSAALATATTVALYRMVHQRLTATEVAAVALEAERDVVGVPCGPLDQWTIVHAPPAGLVLVDCRGPRPYPLCALPPGVRLVICATGVSHDVGGAGYRRRRVEVATALSRLGASSWREVTAASLTDLPPPLDRRARHVVTETARALAAATALRCGDAGALGRLMDQSHASLRDDFEVSTPEVEAAVAAARATPGCLGARLVGAGFGGSVVALVEGKAVARCAAAMRRAGGPAARVWEARPAPGVGVTAVDVVGR